MKLKKSVHNGDVDLSKPYKQNYYSIEIINGNCIMSGLLYGSVPLPYLKVINGDLDIKDSGVLSLHNIEKISGNIYANSNTALEDFGELKKVNGKLIAKDNKKIEQKFNQKFVKYNGKYLDKEALETLNDEEFIL